MSVGPVDLSQDRWAIMNEPPLGADSAMRSALFDRESIEIGKYTSVSSSEKSICGIGRVFGIFLCPPSVWPAVLAGLDNRAE